MILAPLLLLQAVGATPEGLASAAGILESSVRSGEVKSASILVTRRGKTVLHRGFGGVSDRPDTVYLLASITKPVTACALMLLVERGSVALNDPVSRHLPEFTGGDRAKIRVRDLLSHISGLPDMLPENTRSEERRVGKECRSRWRR